MRKHNITSLFYISVSTFLVGILSYLYHPIMVRYLNLKEFAEFESLIGIINLLSVISGAIGLFLVKEFAKNTENTYEIALLSVSKKIGFYIGGIIFFLYILLSPLISIFLNISDIWIIIVIGLTIFLGFLGIYQLSFFQGKKHFKIISALNVINPIFRLLFGIPLVIFGARIFGAVGGFIISQIVLLLIGYQIINKKTNISISNDQKEIEFILIAHFKKEKKQIFQYFFTSLLLALLMNIDILFAKHFFSDETAGIYAGISIIAKFLVFVGMSIETVYYPILTASKSLEKKKVYLLSLLYLTGTVLALGFFFLFGIPILHLFKPGFELYRPLLYLIIIYCGMLALLNFLMKLLIAFGKYSINLLISAVIIITIPFLYLFVGNSPFTLIEIFNLMMGISILISFFIIGTIKKSSDS